MNLVATSATIGRSRMASPTAFRFDLENLSTKWGIPGGGLMT